MLWRRPRRHNVASEKESRPTTMAAGSLVSGRRVVALARSADPAAKTDRCIIWTRRGGGILDAGGGESAVKSVAVGVVGGCVAMNV